MRIARPWDLELEYTRELMLPLALKNAAHWPRRVLCIGLGVAAVPKFLYKKVPHARITVVEISPAVHGVALSQFGCPANDSRFEVIIACGAQYVESAPHTFDWIVIDGFDDKARMGPLSSTVFFEHCVNKLNPGGMVSINLLNNQKDSNHQRVRFAQALPFSVILPPCGSGNTVALGGLDRDWALSEDDLEAEINVLNERAQLNLGPSMARLKANGQFQHGHWEIESSA